MRLVVVALCFLFSAYALEDIYDVDIDKLSAIHHKDFRTTLLRADKRRAVLADESFFLLYGITSNKGNEHAFVVKPAMQNTLQVVKNGEPFEVPVLPVFHGYLAEDPATIIAFSFSGLEDGDLTPLGMAHFASGDHYTFHHDEKDGFFLVEVNATTPHDHVPAPCDVLDNDLVDDEELAKELAKAGLFKKRNVEEAENVHDNGVGSPPILQIELVVQSDVAFAAKFPNGAQQATNYVRTVLAAINTIYERDLRATLVWQYFGFNTANAPANNLNELNTWLVANPQIQKTADVAVIFNGVIAGGLGYLGSVCGPQQTAHLGVSGTWGTNAWDANNDVVVTAHEIGHVIGSPHTHDSSGYDPVIDKCGSNSDDASVIPWDGGSVMSYCHIVNGGNGWKSMSLYMGAVGRFGYQSQRVNSQIRSTLEKAQCISSTDSNWAPYCPDNSNYVSYDGSALRCSEVAANGDCSKPWGATPNCMKSCGRCLTTTNSVYGNLPIYSSNTPSTPPAPPTPVPTPAPTPTYTPPYSPPSSSCDDIANPTITRNGAPVTCQNEALLGKCSEWYNQAPNCKASCGWSGCTPPCDDLPNPVATVTNANGILRTCAQQAQAGFCPYGWMNSRTCRTSCGKCASGDVQLTEEGGQNKPSEKPQEGDWTVSWDDVSDAVDTRDVLFDQGTSCTLNKGIPSTKFIETSSAARAVDDFIVPAGKTWSVREIKVMGSWFVGSDSVPLLQAPKDSEKSIDFYVTIFHSRTIQCKSIISLPLPLSQVVVIDIAASHCLLLGAHDVNGTLVSADEQYYVTVAPLLDVYTQFLWSFSKTQNGDGFKWRDSKNLYGTSECATWTDGSKCGITVAGSDLCFSLLGSSASISSQDTASINSKQTTNGGDGEIGSDSREFTHAWNPEDAAKQAEAIGVVQENSKSLFEKLSTEDENVLSMNEASSNSDGSGTENSWLIPVIVVACVVGVVAVIGVALFVKTRITDRPEVV